VTFWGLVQIFVDLVLIASAGFVWVKLHRPAKDDPRLSRGLQLLQSKISVLEDLSDRTETQVTQLTTLMEQKCRDIQKTIFEAEKEVQKIQAATEKSLEVAKIFQDKIPHQEIIERQNTIKYVKAARMAHSGASIDDIAAVVDLSRGEIEFIAKVNREQLQFSEEDLPAWAKGEALAQEVSTPHDFVEPLIQKPAMPQVSPQVQQTLSNLGAQFRQALNTDFAPQGKAQPEPVFEMPAQPQFPKAAMSPKPAAAAVPPATAQKSTQPKASNQGDVGVVKKVVFPKIEVNNYLG
jgi:mannose/fructose/N-acetylgalactosamine-specific phosphotransferase system component IIB